MLYLIFSRNTPGPEFYRVDYKSSTSEEPKRSERAPFSELMVGLLNELDRRKDPVEPLFERDIPELEKSLITRILTLWNQANKPPFPGI
jgi:hypothetical protein